MKKTIIALALVGIFMLPFGTKAATISPNSDILSRIEVLKAQVVELQKQLDELLSAKKVTYPAEENYSCEPIFDQYGRQRGVYC